MAIVSTYDGAGGSIPYRTRAPSPSSPSPYYTPPGSTYRSPGPAGISNAPGGTGSTATDPVTMLGQLLASQFGGASPGVSTAPQPVVQQVPSQDQGGVNSNTILGVVVVAGVAFGLWYWWKHRKGA